MRGRVPRGGRVLSQPQWDFDQRRVVGPRTVVADELRHHAIEDASEVAGCVLARSKPAAPQIGKQWIVVIGLLLGAQFGLRCIGLLLRLYGHGLRLGVPRLGLAPRLHSLHLRLDLGT